MQLWMTGKRNESSNELTMDSVYAFLPDRVLA